MFAPVTLLLYPEFTQELVRGSAALRPPTVGAPPLIAHAQASPALREARRSKNVSTDELWRHLIACPVNGDRSTRRDDRDVSHPVWAEPAAE